MQIVSFKWYGDKVASAVDRATSRGIKRIGQEVCDKSQRLVPVSPSPGGGYLRDTGRIEFLDGGKTAVITYHGHPETPLQALYVHERTDVHHSGGTQAKFLEQPANEAARDMSRLAAETQAAFK